jgi:hypothetical protein
LTEPLGFATELWRPAAELPEYKAWLANPTLGGPEYEFRYLALVDVLEAAGQAERRLSSLRAKFTEGSTIVDEGIRPGKDPARWDEPLYGSRVGLSQFSEAYDHWIDFLWWTRAFEERLDRRARGGTRAIGLLNTLAPGSVADALRSGLAACRVASLDDVRFLANYTLHHRIIPLGTEARITSTRLWLPIPDPVTRPINSPGELTYQQGRDAVAHATTAFAEVSRFVESMLTKLEDETVRLRPNLASETG